MVAKLDGPQFSGGANIAVGSAKSVKAVTLSVSHGHSSATGPIRPLVICRNASATIRGASVG